MAENLKMNEVFDEFDNAESLSASYSNDHLKELAKALNKASNEKELEEVRNKAPKKVRSIVKIVNLVSGNLNLRLNAVGSKHQFDVKKRTSYSAANDFYGKVEVSYAANSVNFNLKKLAKLPALEVYAIVTKSLYQLAAEELAASKEENHIKLEDLTNTAEEEKLVEKPKEFVKAKSILAGYLKKFIQKHFADDFKKFDNISNFVATQVLLNLDEKDYEKIINKFFDFEEINDFAKNEVKQFIGQSENARVKNLSNRANELMIGKYDENGNFVPATNVDELVAASYHEQALELLSSNVLDKYRKIDKSGHFEYSSEIKSFCDNYVTNFMAKNNLAGIKVTFDSKGALGSYIDAGDTHSININLSKIGSLTELVMTLSHELTHAVDSSINKLKGLENEDGTGLLNTIDEDISRTGLTGENLSLLKELKNYCYHVNPNERRARIGELSAIEFMKKATENDSFAQTELKMSVERFKAYQQRTIDLIAGNKQKGIPTLEEKISDFKARFKNASGISAKDSKMIQERIKYLENMLEFMNEQNMSVQNEIDSIEAANKIINQETKKKEVKKQIEEIQEMEMWV